MNFVKIKSIKKLNKKEKVYDIEVEEDHSFFANGICVHNCSAPNIQQSPKNEEYMKIFKCPKGYDWWEADVSGFHLRIAAEVSQDPEMIKVFKTHGDLHSLTANSVFYRDISFEEFLKHKKEEPYSKYRQEAKAVNFRFIYLGSAYGFRKTIDQNWSQEEMKNYIESNKLKIKEDHSKKPDFALTIAEDIRSKFFAKYNVLYEYLLKSLNIARKNGYIDNYFGARRHLPELLYTGRDIGKKDISGLDSIITNAPILSFEAIYMFRKMVNVSERLKREKMKSKMRVMVHDSIGGYVPIEEKEQLYWVLKEEFDRGDNFSIPMAVDIKYGKVRCYGEEVHYKK